MLKEKQKVANFEITEQPSTIINSPFERFKLKVRLSVDFIYVAMKYLKNPVKAVKVVKILKDKYTTVYGEPLLSKVSKVDGRYYWKYSMPGFPSLAAQESRATQINRLFPFRKSKGLGILLMGITKKCPLSCEHCYEWDRMHAKEKLSTDDLVHIMHKYQDYGTPQIQLGGGEPMLRVDAIYEMLDKAKKGTDFWITTSGWNLNDETAQKLKAKGLTGVMVSLDNHIPEKHDEFRGRKGTFEMVINAVMSAKKANLVTGICVCPTRAYTNEKNIKAYMELAKKLGVTFVQVFEPKPAGRYAGKDILLEKWQLEILEKFYLDYNQLPQYKEYPIINYIGYHQRRTGCFGSGDFYFYIDTDGDAHKCPLCSSKICNTLEFSAEDTISLLQQTQGCNYFAQSAPYVEELEVVLD
jgi:MoaA/NifB/PqqE/SkfB family radical SAM enzyme